MTVEQLRAHFDDYRARYFPGRLRRYQVVLTDRFPDDHPGEGYCDTTRNVIYVRQGMDAQPTRRTLLHEMCHVGCPGHGKKFQQRLRALAAQGEAWAEDEAKQCQEVLRGVSTRAHST